MIDNSSNSTPNVELSTAQLEQLYVFQKKLDIVRGEVDSANKTLRSLRGEIDQATKDKIYADEQLEKSNARLSESQKKISDLNETHLAKTSEYSGLLSDIASTSQIHAEKASELKDRENAVSKKEQDIFSAQESLTERETKHEENEARFNAKVKKIQDAISG